MILISVQNVQKGFGAHEVLRDVTFSLQKGEKMGQRAEAPSHGSRRIGIHRSRRVRR